MKKVVKCSSSKGIGNMKYIALDAVDDLDSYAQSMQYSDVDYDMEVADYVIDAKDSKVATATVTFSITKR